MQRLPLLSVSEGKGLLGAGHLTGTEAQGSRVEFPPDEGR